MPKRIPARGYMPTCPHCDTLGLPDAVRCSECGARFGLTPTKIEDVGAAAMAVQHAAGKLRDLTNDEPRGQPRGHRYVALRDLTRELEDVRRRLLELWS